MADATAPLSSFAWRCTCFLHTIIDLSIKSSSQLWLKQTHYCKNKWTSFLFCQAHLTPATQPDAEAPPLPYGTAVWHPRIGLILFQSPIPILQFNGDVQTVQEAFLCAVFVSGLYFLKHKRTQIIWIKYDDLHRRHFHLRHL